MKDYNKYSIEIYTKTEGNRKYVAVVFDSDVDIEAISLIMETTLSVFGQYSNQIENAIYRTAVNTMIAFLNSAGPNMRIYFADGIKKFFQINNNKITYVTKDGKIICNFIYEK